MKPMPPAASPSCQTTSNSLAWGAAGVFFVGVEKMTSLLVVGFVLGYLSCLFLAVIAATMTGIALSRESTQ